MGAFRLLAAIRTRPELRSVKIWCNELRHNVIYTTSPWTSWALSGSSPPSRPGRSSGQSQNMTSWAQEKRHLNTLTMDFMGAFRLFAAIRARLDLRSDSKHDVTSFDMMSSIRFLIGHFYGDFWLLAAIQNRSELRAVSKCYVTSSDMMSSIHPHHGLHGRLQAPPHHPHHTRAQVSLQIWRHKLRYDVVNTPSQWTWCINAFRLLTANQRQARNSDHELRQTASAVIQSKKVNIIDRTVKYKYFLLYYFLAAFYFFKSLNLL